MPRNTVTFATSLRVNLSEVFKQLEESFSDKDNNESKRGLWVSEESGREVALPTLINEALKQDL